MTYIQFLNSKTEVVGMQTNASGRLKNDTILFDVVWGTNATKERGERERETELETLIMFRIYRDNQQIIRSSDYDHFDALFVGRPHTSLRTETVAGPCKAL